VVYSDTSELDAACLEVAKATKWTRKLIDAEEITSLAERYAKIARAHLSEPLDINPNVMARAIRYLGHVHAIPPMEDDLLWFDHMLQALLEVARPNTGLDARSKPFLKDMLRGIAIASED